MTAKATNGRAYPSTPVLVRSYLNAKRAVVEAGFAAELEWQHTRRPWNVTEVEFLRQAAWVVLSAGMSEAVVRGVFPRFTRVLHGFVPSRVCSDGTTRGRALDVFRHTRKVDAVLAIAGTATRLGTDGLRRELARDPLGFVSQLPYMGPATSRHLAKNLGVSVVKPDRHLIRITDLAGRDSAQAMCEEIGSWLGEPVCVVDIVLWRWATIHTRRCGNTSCDGLPHE